MRPRPRVEVEFLDRVGVEGLDASGAGGYEASRDTAMPATTIAREALPGYWGRGSAATTSLGIVPV